MRLAIIPARGGSKSIKDKNIVHLGGKPLISYSIKTALSCKKIDKIIVSTDSPKIAHIAKKCGAEVPFLRPKKLATDTSPVVLTVQHALGWLEKRGNFIENIILLQPTSPFRRVQDINKAIKILSQPNTDSVVGVCEAKYNPYHVMTTIRNSYLLYPLFKTKKSIHYRQATPIIYRINGSLYVFKRDTIMEKGTIFTDKTRPLIMPEELSVDIDSQNDLLWAEFILKNQKLS